MTIKVTIKKKKGRTLNDDKRPKFSSDRYQFTAIMPSLNYNVAQDNYISELIIAKIRNKNKIARTEIKE